MTTRVWRRRWLEQAQRGLERPSERHVDGAYVSAGSIQQAKGKGGELMGPAQPRAARAGVDPGYRIEAFEVSMGERHAICPEGKPRTPGSQLVAPKNGKVTYRFEFGRHCRDCRVRSVCVPPTPRPRTIVVGALHDTLQQRRREPQTPEFQLRMHQRNGIEGTVSELVRGHGLRRARYKGWAKVDLQNQFVAAACNVKRWLQKLLRGAFPEGAGRRWVSVKPRAVRQRACRRVWDGSRAQLPRFELSNRPLSEWAALA